VSRVHPTWRPGEEPGRHPVPGGDSSRLVLRDGMLATGERVDVVLSGASIDEVVPTATGAGGAAEVVDLQGRLLLPAFVEPHAHLDKALTADFLANPAGDLAGAIQAVAAAWKTLTIEDTVGRALAAARKLVLSGTTAIRTHIDMIPENESKSPRALAEVRQRLRGICDLQVVALAHPLTGPEATAGRAALERGLELGVDVVGGAPHFEPDPRAAIAFGLEVARERGLAVDFHLDEVLDVTVQHLGELARQTAKRGMEGRVTASHCVSHGLLPPAEQRELGRILADSGVSVVTLPRTNLFIQGRGIEDAPPRGLPGLRALLDAGVTVAAGGDNAQDPFYPIGRSDPLETATFLIAAAHLDVEEAFEAVSTAGRRILGLDPVRVTPGSPAELVALRAATTRQAVAEQPGDRVVVHAGRVVARTETQEWVAGE
jgi:cytosine deaminase